MPFSGRRTIYMDCSRSLEQLEGRIESPYGPSGGAISLVDPDTIIRRETAAYDRFGNVTGYGRSGPSVTSLSAQYTVNAQNQVTEALIDSVAIEPVYDANGNLKEPGDGRRFAYDPFNNLTHVYQTNGGSEYLYARFWYNANGRRIAAAYNEDQDPGLTEAVFDDDRVEFFAYDDLWRLRAVYAREAGQADATCRERYAYNPAGMNGKPSSAPLDSPLFGQIDEAGDGTFERSFYLIQNTLGDVIKIVEGAGGTQHEEIRYTLYGEPYIVNWMADINQDGAVDGEDIISFFALWDVGAFGSDTNGDGGVDGDDVIQFLAWWDNGEGAGRTTEDNRFGFRGYVWDDRLQMYHVRHRVYDPTPGPAGLRWLQRDPAFFVDGLNLYAYCGGDPVNCLDPMGLESWLIGTMFRSIGLPSIGEHVDDAVDGAAELGSYWYNVDSVDDVLTDASDSEARQEVHDALQTAKEAASYVPVAGDLAGHAVNIVDKGLGVWDEYLDGPDPNACGMLPGGGNVFTPAVDELLEAIVGGVADRAKGKKPKAAKNGAVEPYDVDEYGKLKDRARREGKTGDLQMDHQPSNASNLARERAKSPDGKLTRKQELEIQQRGLAVAVPRTAHKKGSPTFAGRNTSDRIQSDARNPAAAAARDADAMVAAAEAKHKDAAQRAADEVKRRAGGLR